METLILAISIVNLILLIRTGNVLYTLNIEMKKELKKLKKQNYELRKEI